MSFNSKIFWKEVDAQTDILDDDKAFEEIIKTGNIPEKNYHHYKIKRLLNQGGIIC